MKAALRSACGVFVAAMLASVHAQPAPDAPISGEVVIATDTGLHVAMVGSSFRIVKGARLLNTLATVATISPDGRYLLVSLAERLSSAARHEQLTRPFYMGPPFYSRGRAQADPSQAYRAAEFNSPVALYEFATDKTTTLNDLSIRCATWAPDGHAFAFVSERGIGVMDVQSAKARILVPSSRRRYEIALGWVDGTTGVSGVSGGDMHVLGRQECGPWISNTSFAYRAFTGEWPKDYSKAESLASQADSGGIIRVDAKATPIPIGNLTVLDASGDGRTVIVTGVTDDEGPAPVYVADLSGEALRLGARLPMSLEGCRFTQHAKEVVCLRRSGGNSSALTVIDTSSRVEIGHVEVPALSDWFWIGQGSERKALIVQRDRIGREVAIAVADAGRGTLTPVLDQAAISRLTGETAGLRVIGWIPSREP